MAAVRRITTTLSLGLCLLGCAPRGEPVELLTAETACFAGGEQPVYGLLSADPEYGTRFNGTPVIWPVGFTGVQLVGGEVAVLNQTGNVVATTGKEYGIAHAAHAPGWEARRLVNEIGAFPAAVHCRNKFFEVP